MVSVTEVSETPGVRQMEQAARTAEQAGDMDRALGYFRGLGQIEPQNPKWALEAVRILRASGRGGEAAEALRQALRKWPNARQLPDVRHLVPDAPEAELRQALGQDMPPDEALKRSAIADDGQRDCIMARGGRKTAVIVFTGLADRMVLPLPLFDRYLAELDLSAIYLRDRKRIGYMNGVSSLGEDYDDTLATLRAMLKEMGAETVHTIGNSAGGIGAVSYGLDLGAKTVMGFSAPVALTRAAADADRRTSRFAERILGDAVPAGRRDLRARAEASPETAIHLFYGSEMPEDIYHASWLEPVKSVVMHPLPGLAGHGALFQFAQAKGLRPLFREMFGTAD